MTFEEDTQVDQNAPGEWHAPELVELQAAGLTESGSIFAPDGVMTFS